MDIEQTLRKVVHNVLHDPEVPRSDWSKRAYGLIEMGKILQTKSADKVKQMAAKNPKFDATDLKTLFEKAARMAAGAEEPS